MNLRAVGWLLGCVLLLLGAFVLAPLVVALLYGELRPAYAFLWTAIACALTGGGLVIANRGSTQTPEGGPSYHRREGLAVVGLTWILISVFGALPFLLSGVMTHPADAIFETCSGFTTTGCSVLSPSKIDAAPASIHFWRCLTHWMGGIGIVLVFVVLVPLGGRSLFRSEQAGISREASLQRVRDSALALVRVYVALTLVHALLLKLAGLSVFDAVVHAFSTIATGGFSSHGASIAYYQSWVVEAIVIVFMLASGVNFGLWDAVVRQGPRAAWRAAWGSDEFKLYLGLVAGSSGACALVLWFWGGSNGLEGSDLPDYSSLLLSLRDSAFSVTSMQTCTGYATADFDRWPSFCRMVVIFAAYLGACAGSTGGGLKVVRVVILLRVALVTVRSFTRPRSLQQVRLDGQALGPDVVAGATRYFVLWTLVAVGGVVVLTLMGSDLITSGSAVIVCLNNAGPGLGAVGPAADYGGLPALSKLLLSAYMVLGRLEFFAIFALFVPGFWRR